MSTIKGVDCIYYCHFYLFLFKRNRPSHFIQCSIVCNNNNNNNNNTTTTTQNFIFCFSFRLSIWLCCEIVSYRISFSSWSTVKVMTRGRSSSGAPARGLLPYMGNIAMCRLRYKDMVLKYPRGNDQVWTNITCEQALHLKVARVEGHVRRSRER